MLSTQQRIAVLRSQIEAILQEQSLNAKKIYEICNRLRALGEPVVTEPDTVDPQTKGPLAEVIGEVPGMRTKDYHEE